VFTGTFDYCATLRFDRDADLDMRANLPCGRVTKAPTNPRTGRSAG
jgi:hypothetical protein